MLLMTSIGSDTASAIPTVNTPVKTFLNRQKTCNRFVIFPTSISGIENIISNLNLSKSIGPFSIPTKLLKILKTFVSGPLAYLINCSFSSAVIPDKFQIARVIPVYKKGLKCLCHGWELAYFNSLGYFKRICNIFYTSKISSSCTFGGLKLAISRNAVSIKKLGRGCCCDVIRGTCIHCKHIEHYIFL